MKRGYRKCEASNLAREIMPASDWWHPVWSHPMFPLLFMAICLVIFLFVMFTRHGPWNHRRDRWDPPHRTTLDVLNERFARGEIDKAEYQEKRRLISL